MADTPPPPGDTPPPIPGGTPPPPLPPGFPPSMSAGPPTGATPPPPPPVSQPPGYAAAPTGPDGAPPPPGYVPFGTPPSGGGQRTNGLAVASLVLGIVGIILCVLFIPWILAIIFGAVAIKQCNDDPTYTGKGLAIAGLVCGLVGGALILLIIATGDSNFNYDFGSVVLGALR